MKFPHLLLLLAALAVGCEVKTNVSVNSGIDEAKTKEVLDHHWNTFQANDLDGVMADYTEESVLIIPDKTVSGLYELRNHFATVFDISYGTDTFIIKDGKIVRQTFAGVVVPQ